MDQSEVKRIVEEKSVELVSQLGLEHWKLRVYYAPCANTSHMADILVKPDYSRAYITIDPHRHDDASEVLDSLTHELLHVVHAPMYHLYKLLTANLSEAEMKAADIAFTFAKEQQVVALQRMYEGLKRCELAEAPQG